MGIQLPEKYKENFDVSSGPRSGRYSEVGYLTSQRKARNVEVLRVFSGIQVVVSPSIRIFLIISTTDVLCTYQDFCGISLE